jgi:hypothetical protein
MEDVTPADSPHPAAHGEEPLRHVQEEGQASSANDLPTQEAEDELVARYVQDVWRQEKDARVQVEARWKDQQGLLQNDHDFSGKADWQSQVVISKIPNATNAQLAILKGGLTQTREWFDLEGSEDPAIEALLPDFKDLLRAELEQRDPTTRRDFLDEWCLALKGGLVAAWLHMKIYPVNVKREVRVFRLEKNGLPSEAGGEGLDRLEAEMRARQAETLGGGIGLPQVPAPAPMGAGGPPPMKLTSALEKRTEVRIVKEMVSPFDFVTDSTGRGAYEVQRISGDLDDLDYLPAKSGYKLERLAEAKSKASGKQTTDQEEEAQRDPSGTLGQSRTERRQWEGLEFFGDIPGPAGELLHRNVAVTVIEGVVVRCKPAKFGSPWRSAALEPMPFGYPGRAPMENVAGLARMFIEFTNAIVDGVLYEVLGAFELDAELLENAQAAQTGINPGKVFVKRDRAGTGNQLIKRIETGKTPQSAGQLLEFLERQMDQATNVNETGRKPYVTATAVSDDQQSANTVFRSIAQWMEKASLEPSLDAVFQRMIEFKILGPGGKEWCERHLGKQRAAAFYQKLYALAEQRGGSFDLDVEIHVRALSSILAKAAELDRLSRLFEVLRAFPGMANRLELGELSKRTMSVLGYAAEQLVKSPEKLAVVDQLEQVTMERLALAAGQQPASHSGTSVAAAGATTPAGR